MNVVQKLRQLVGEVRKAASPAKADEAWALAARLLGRMPVTAEDAQRVCAARDVDGLDRLVAGLESAAVGGARDGSARAAGAAEGSTLEHEMELALRAFKKRLKLARLADESKLRGRRLTGGQKSEIDAIIPPTEYPSEVWAALARAGKLKDTGGGFYALP